jgi:hypothetical protein
MHQILEGFMQQPHEIAAVLKASSATPATNGHAPGHYRLRYDRLDTKGRMSIRRAGRMHHLGVGAAHARKRVLAFADDRQITVADLATGEILSTHLIDPNENYWRNQEREPGRWPSSQKRDLRPDSSETYVPTHHRMPEEGLEPPTRGL